MHKLLLNLEESQEVFNKVKSAASAKLTPVSMDSENQSAYFIGHSGKYTTTLDGCMCKDFILHKKPCKHMYRLAHELGYLNIPNVVSDPSQIPSESISESKPTTPQRRKATDYCIGAVNAAGETAARALQSILAYRNATATKRQPCPCGDISPLAPFFTAGILQTVDAPELLLTAFGKKASVDSLISQGYSFPPELKKTISARFDYILQHAAALQPMVCPTWQAVVPANQLIIAEAKVYQYLNKTFSADLIFYY